MALVPCPECQKEVSTQALACPQCALPFPGKQGVSENSVQSDKLYPCPDCGFLISKQARSCPNCGVNKIEEQQPQVTPHESLKEENWLCPHCGTPYTRKVKIKDGETKLVSQEVPPSIKTNTESSHSQILNELDFHPPEQESLLPLRSRSPLWQDSSMEKEVDFSPPQFPGKKKTSVILLILLLIVVAVAGSLGALWHFEGISPLDILSDLGIPISETFPRY